MFDEQKALAIHSEESEQAVLGSILVDEKCFDLVKDWIPEEDVFYNLKHKEIWKAISELKKENIPVDFVNVSSKIRGITYYLTGLVDKVPTTANVSSYARQLNEDWLRRKLVKQSQVIAQQALDNTNDISTLLEEVHETAGSLMNLEPGQTFDINDLLKETKESLFNQKNMTPTGLESLRLLP